ncbi:MAG: glycerate kinase [Acidobacteriota bacterium]
MSDARRADARRADARRCFEAALAAIDAERLVVDALAETPFDDAPVHLIAIGKAAAPMSRGAMRQLGDRLVSRLVVVPASETAELAADPLFATSTIVGAGHPVPDAGSVEAGRAIEERLARLDAEDRVLVLISGGGSALVTAPLEGLDLDHISATTTAILRAGGRIDELNTVRKHLDRIKGGRLARLASPAPVLGLVLSDVIGDRLDVIASGPLSPDPTTYDDARAVIERLGIADQLPQPVRDVVTRGCRGEVAESPKPDDACFDSVQVRVVGSNRIAVDAVLAEARERGYDTLVLSTSIEGEARQVGAVLAAIAKEIRATGRPVATPACVVAAGETTVTVRGSGRGGRNQEVALGAAQGLDGVPDVVVAALGTDGIDGPTDAAGGFVDGTTVQRVQAIGGDVESTLVDNDAYTLLARLDDLIVTGATGTNVMDLYLLLVG